MVLFRISGSYFFFFSSRRRHTRYWRDWSSDVCSSDLDEDGETKATPIKVVNSSCDTKTEQGKDAIGYDQTYIMIYGVGKAKITFTAKDEKLAKKIGEVTYEVESISAEEKEKQDKEKYNFRVLHFVGNPNEYDESNSEIPKQVILKKSGNGQFTRQRIQVWGYYDEDGETKATPIKVVNSSCDTKTEQGKDAIGYDQTYIMIYGVGKAKITFTAKDEKLAKKIGEVTYEVESISAEEKEKQDKEKYNFRVLHFVGNPNEYDESNSEIPKQVILKKSGNGQFTRQRIQVWGYYDEDGETKATPIKVVNSSCDTKTEQGKDAIGYDQTYIMIYGVGKAKITFTAKDEKLAKKIGEVTYEVESISAEEKEKQDKEKYNFRVLHFVGNPNEYDESNSEIPKQVILKKSGNGQFTRQRIQVWGYYDEDGETKATPIKVVNSSCDTKTEQGKDAIGYDQTYIMIYGVGKAKITFTAKDEKLAKKIGEVTYEVESISAEEKEKQDKEKYNFRVLHFVGNPNEYDESNSEIPKQVILKKSGNGQFTRQRIQVWGYYDEDGETKATPIKVVNSSCDTKTEQGKDAIGYDQTYIMIYGVGKAKITFTAKDEKLAKKIGEVTYEVESISAEEKEKQDKEKYNFRVLHFVGNPNEYDESNSEIPKQVILKKSGNGQFTRQRIQVWGYYDEDGETKATPIKVVNSSCDTKTEQGKDAIGYDQTYIMIYGVGKAKITFTAKDEKLAKKIGEVTYEVESIEREEEEKGEREDFGCRGMNLVGNPNEYDESNSEIPKQVILKKSGNGQFTRQRIQVWGYYDEDGETKATPIKVVNSSCDTKTEQGKDAIGYDQTYIMIYGVGKAKITFTAKDEKLAKKIGEVTYEVESIDGEAPSKPFSIDVDVPSNIKSGQDVNVTATAKCSDKLENAKNALLIVGLYKSEGDVNKMINYSYVEKTMEPNKTVTLGAGFGIPENAKGYKVKVFVWDMWPNETQGGKALSEVKEFTVQ